MLAQRWLKTKATYYQENPKRVYYLSMEFLIGRSLSNNMLNMAIDPLIREMLQEEGVDLLALAEPSPTRAWAMAASGGLRPASSIRSRPCRCRRNGYGLRYEYGVFRLEIATASRPKRPTTGCGVRIPGKSCVMADTVSVRVNAHLRIERGQARLESNHPSRVARHSIRPSRHRLRRQEHQYAASVGARPLRSSSTFWSSATGITSEPCSTG